MIDILKRSSAGKIRAVMNHRRLVAVTLAIALPLGPAAVSPAGQSSDAPVLEASYRDRAVFVSLRAQDIDDLNRRLSNQSRTTVSWSVKLQRVGRFGFRGFLASATVRATIQPVDPNRFTASRVVNGEVTEAGTIVDREGAHAWLLSFSDARLFERYYLEPLSTSSGYSLQVTAKVEGGGGATIVTSDLAQARLSTSHLKSLDPDLIIR